MTWKKLLLVPSLLAVVALGVATARADVTPIIMPSPHPAPEMSTGITIKPSADGDGFVHNPTALTSTMYSPVVTAVPFGGELDQ